MVRVRAAPRLILGTGEKAYKAPPAARSKSVAGEARTALVFTPPYDRLRRSSAFLPAIVLEMISTSLVFMHTVKRLESDLFVPYPV